MRLRRPRGLRADPARWLTVAAFTYKSARSSGLVIGVSIVIIIETFALHMLTVTKHPFVAWGLTLSSLSALWWFIADYRAMGVGAVNTSATDIDVRIGRRASVFIPRANVANAIRPTFRDLPQAGAGLSQGYVNLTKQVTPNVLLTLREPAVVSIGGIVRQPARQIGLHLDDPDAFLAELQ